jgi:hypothetical protein
MLLVYGTRGTPEENAWAFARARYDAETFWYRGNGAMELCSDTEFADPRESPHNRDRNVVLYGNADTNGAWNALLSDSPVVVRRSGVTAGDHTLPGDDLACLFVRPRPGSDRALVGIVSGTGLPGMRLTDRIPYFVSGVEYPDCIVLGPNTLTGGAAGVRMAGFFGNDWTLATGDFQWQ